MQFSRKLLGRLALDDRLAESIGRSGLLEVLFSSTRPDTHLMSLDGNKTIAWVTPAGTIASLLVQDYFDGGGVRVIPFEFGNIEIVNEGGTISIFLSGPANRIG